MEKKTRLPVQSPAARTITTVSHETSSMQLLGSSPVLPTMSGVCHVAWVSPGESVMTSGVAAGADRGADKSASAARDVHANVRGRIGMPP